MGEVEKTIAQENEMECLRTGVLNQCLLMYFKFMRFKKPLMWAFSQGVIKWKKLFHLRQGEACQNSANSLKNSNLINILIHVDFSLDWFYIIRGELIKKQSFLGQVLLKLSMICAHVLLFTKGFKSSYINLT